MANARLKDVSGRAERSILEAPGEMPCLFSWCLVCWGRSWLAGLRWLLMVMTKRMVIPKGTWSLYTVNDLAPPSSFPKEIEVNGLVLYDTTGKQLSSNMYIISLNYQPTHQPTHQVLPISHSPGVLSSRASVLIASLEAPFDPLPSFHFEDLIWGVWGWGNQVHKNLASPGSTSLLLSVSLSNDGTITRHTWTSDSWSVS